MVMERLLRMGRNSRNMLILLPNGPGVYSFKLSFAAHNGFMLLAFAHTNVEWYPYKEQGSFFRLVRGELEYMPMRVDGSMVVEDIALVDFDRIDKEDYNRCKQIKKELESRP